MHQTTVRFGSELWRALEQEAEALGVSVAHYVREAALARLAYSAGRRGDVAFDEALGGAAAGRPAVSVSVRAAQAESESALAVSEQGRQARERASHLRAEAAARRSEVASRRHDLAAARRR